MKYKNTFDYKNEPKNQNQNKTVCTKNVLELHKKFVCVLPPSKRLIDRDYTYMHLMVSIYIIYYKCNVLIFSPTQSYFL